MLLLMRVSAASRVGKGWSGRGPSTLQEEFHRTKEALQGKEPAPFVPLLSLLTQRGVEFRCGVFLETRRQYEAPTLTVLHTQIGGHVEEHGEGGGAEHKAGVP